MAFDRSISLGYRVNQLARCSCDGAFALVHGEPGVNAAAVAAEKAIEDTAGMINLALVLAWLLLDAAETTRRRAAVTP